MSYQDRVDEAVGVTHIGDTAPSYPDTADTWLDTTANPNVLKVYNGSTWTTLGNFPSTGGSTWSGLVSRPKRNIWNYISDDEPTVPEEGYLWYAPTSDTAKMYNGSAWVAFAISVS